MYYGNLSLVRKTTPEKVECANTPFTYSYVVLLRELTQRTRSLRRLERIIVSIGANASFVDTVPLNYGDGALYIPRYGAPVLSYISARE